MRPAALATTVLLITGLAFAATGCGGDDESETVTTERTVTETEAPGAEATETEATAPETQPGDEIRNEGPRYFETPSGNIGCYVSAQAARCDIREHSWSAPSKPASCELDYGQGIVVGSNGAEFVCAGDTSLGGKATLAYGSASQRGRFRCESEEAGVTCTLVTTGAGFFLSRESYRIF